MSWTLRLGPLNVASASAWTSSRYLSTYSFAVSLLSFLACAQRTPMHAYAALQASEVAQEPCGCVCVMIWEKSPDRV
eukprot:3378290-Rhodomonas_salina.2